MIEPAATVKSLRRINRVNQSGISFLIVKTKRVDKKKSLSAKGSKQVPKGVILLNLLAMYPSIKSVKEAAVKSKSP
ncbi:MAG: hypothetical protein OHK0040_05420 [bacterium]